MLPTKDEPRWLQDQATFQKAGFDPLFSQGAEKESVQYILDGKQSMTVFKDVRTLAMDAITTVSTFLAGGTPVKTTTYNNGKIDVPAMPSAIVTVTRDNVRQALIDSGYYKSNDFTGLP